MATGQVRIIGGKWRGRKLKVPEIKDLRPTPDRVRETLFNWLQSVVVGAHCLDAFAGSGALGFEALSRGAKHLVLVDESKTVVDLLQQELILFNADNAEVYRATLPHGLKKPAVPFDIVFLDPPFQKNILLPCCFYLEENHFLAKESYIYLESKDKLTQNVLPSHWQLEKIKTAGQVNYHLVKRVYA